jgi:hypothetical protein
MESQKLSVDIVDRYIEVELLMASLYERFAQRYTSHGEFWQSMVSEEHEHAAWVQHFKKGLMSDSIRFSEGKTRISALDSGIAYIKRIIQGFDLSPPDRLKAVSISLDLERSLIERSVFKHFESDSSEVTKILRVLREAQEEHVKKVERFQSTIRTVAL